MNDWISITEQLPEVGQDVLVYVGAGGRGLLTYQLKGDELYDEMTAPGARYAESDGFYIYESVDGKIRCRRHADIITHWMPLPEPPEK